MNNFHPPTQRALQRRDFVLAAGAIGAGLFTLPAWAAPYPDKPVRLVVPFPAGGATDFMARSLAQRLSERLGQPVVIDNRAGAGGALGAETVATATPDGYTLLFSTMGVLTINPSIYKSLRYDPQRSFEPVTTTHSTSNVLVVHPSVRAGTVEELLGLARKSPGQLTFASAGNGTTSHLSGELFNSLGGVDILHVPYKGSAPAMIDFLSGRISMMFDTTSNFVEHVKAGRLRALGLTGRKRSSAMPGVSPIAETPGMAAYDVSLWLGVLAPAGTPSALVLKLQTDIHVVMSTAEMGHQLSDAGIEVRLSSPQDFAALVRSDATKWAAVVKRANIPAL